MKNRKLAKHIGDAAWHSFVAKLAYKAEAAGKHLVKVDQWFASSKTCNSCGFEMEKMPLNVRSWECPAWSNQADRDLNAALNIRDRGIIDLKAAGLVVTAYGGLHKTGNLPATA